MSQLPGRTGRLALATLVWAIVSAGALSAPAAARTAPFAVDLYERGDFVPQARSDWCVPAAIQTMANLSVGGKAGGGTVPSQRRLDRLARSLSSDRLVGPG